MEHHHGDGSGLVILFTGLHRAASLQVDLVVMWCVVELGVARLQAGFADLVDAPHLQSVELCSRTSKQASCTCFILVQDRAHTCKIADAALTAALH